MSTPLRRVRGSCGHRGEVSDVPSAVALAHLGSLARLRYRKTSAGARISPYERLFSPLWNGKRGFERFIIRPLNEAPSNTPRLR